MQLRWGWNVAEILVTCGCVCGWRSMNKFNPNTLAISENNVKYNDVQAMYPLLLVLCLAYPGIVEGYQGVRIWGLFGVYFKNKCFHNYFSKGPNDRQWKLQPPPLWMDTVQERRLEWLWFISCDHQYLVSMHTICNKHNLYLVAVPASLPRGAATPPPRLPLTCTSSPARPWPAPTPSSLAPSSRGGGQCWRCSWLFSLEIQTTGKDDPLVGASSQIRESTSHFIFQNIA